jgi:1-phosphatidylinositol-4-phosphate 5-kinase
VIDILQEFDLRKKVESAVKGIRYNKRVISAVESSAYAERMIKFLEDHME